MVNLVNRLGRLLKQYEEKKRTSETVKTEKNEKEAFQKIIQEARKDWENAHSFFNNVSDPDLIDHAIYAMEAAEKKYQYLLKQARLHPDYSDKRKEKSL